MKLSAIFANALLCGVLLAGALPASAQDVQWKLVDTGVLTHASHGKGIEMRIQPSPVPDDLFSNEDSGDLLLALCNHYAPHVIPFVQQKSEIGTPDFIAVRIVSGGTFGRYILETFAISDGECGDAL